MGARLEGFKSLSFVNSSSTPRLVVLTVLVMGAFATNSLLCREALASRSIGVAEFTFARLVSGAAVLWLLVALRGGKRDVGGDWLSAAALFGYAACFSFAYLTLSAGTGALLLFGAVQISMISWGLLRGERLTSWQWFGLASAFAGLAWFVSPGVEAPPLLGAVLMVAAGICWGIYSLRGRGTRNATVASAGNFIRAVPLAAALYLLAFDSSDQSTWVGWVLAIASGALASGLGYALWYSVLPRLTAGTSATVQLSVPLIAAVGGVLFLGEALTIRLEVAAAVVLGGIYIFVHSGSRA